MSCRHTEGAEVQLHSFSTTALDRGERQTSNPGHFTPEENSGHTPNRRLGGPQSRYVPEFRVSTYVPEFRSRIVQPAAQSLHGVIAAGSIYHDDGHSTLSGYQIIMWRHVKSRYIPTTLHGVTPRSPPPWETWTFTICSLLQGSRKPHGPGQYSFQES